MGGTPLIELYVVFQELARICQGRGVAIARSLVGSYITSLEMAGCSITLVRVDDELLRLWDAPVEHRRSALGDVSEAGIRARERARARARGGTCRSRVKRSWPGSAPTRRPSPRTRIELTRLDADIGDADHGTNMDRGLPGGGRTSCRASAGQDVGAILKAVGMTLISTVGGACGPLYGTLFLQMAAAAGGEAGAHAGRVGVGPPGRRRRRGQARQGAARRQDHARQPRARGRGALGGPGQRGGHRRGAVALRACRATRGCWTTIPLVARKGRASYLGRAQRRPPGSRRHLGRIFCSGPRPRRGRWAAHEPGAAIHDRHRDRFPQRQAGRGRGRAGARYGRAGGAARDGGRPGRPGRSAGHRRHAGPGGHRAASTPRTGCWC